MTSIWTRLIKRINTALDSFVDGVADELHAMDMKDQNHLFWHPDCQGHAGDKKPIKKAMFFYGNPPSPTGPVLIGPIRCGKGVCQDSLCQATHECQQTTWKEA